MMSEFLRVYRKTGKTAPHGRKTTGSALAWLGFGWSTGLASRRTRPAADSGRRLLVEPMEGRLLLSAYSPTVSEGGTVVLDWPNSSAGGHATITYSSSGAVDIGSVDGSFSGVAVDAADSPGRPQVASGDSLSIDGGDTRENPSDESESTGLAGPKNIDLAREDLAPPPRQGGMVDLAQAAYDTVFAEIGAAVNVSQEAGIATLEPSAGADSGDLFPSAEAAGHQRPEGVVKSITGSRGRLAAFDLAMRQESAFHWRTVAEEDADLNVSGEAVPGDPATAGAVPIDRPAVEASSGLQRAPASRSILPDDMDSRATPAPVAAAAHDSPAAGSPGPAASEADAAAQVSPALQNTTPGTGAVSASAVSLDHSRQKNATHLALVLGIGQTILHRRTHLAEEVEHEQPPPRRR